MDDRDMNERARQNQSIDRETARLRRMQAQEERETARQLRVSAQETASLIPAAQSLEPDAVAHLVNRLNYTEVARLTGRTEAELRQAFRQRSWAKAPAVLQQYAGYHITVAVMSDELGDTSIDPTCDEAASYEAFRGEYADAIRAEFPGASVQVRQSNNGGIRSADERPTIEGFDLSPVGDDDISAKVEQYEELCMRVQSIGEEVFERGAFWRFHEEVE